VDDAVELLALVEDAAVLEELEDEDALGAVAVGAVG
jgi:hypothetical protein